MIIEKFQGAIRIAFLQVNASGYETLFAQHALHCWLLTYSRFLGSIALLFWRQL